MDDILKYDKFKEFYNLIQGTTLKNNIMPYGFSFALHTGENAEEIIKNRIYFQKKLDFYKDFDIVLANQTHSDNIALIEKNETLGWHSSGNAIKDCDALITNKKNVLIGVLTADCVPILLYDKAKEVVAAVHAGWKGSKSEIVLKTVKKMTDVFESDPKDIYAVIGPSIGNCCYEVGSDVADNFNENVKDKLKSGKYMLDIRADNYDQLIRAGLVGENVELSGICTSCDNNRFFSYRKENGCSGRSLSFIGLRE